MKTNGLFVLLAFMFFVTLANAQTEEVYYNPKLPQVDMQEAQTTLARILEETRNIQHPNSIHISGYGHRR